MESFATFYSMSNCSSSGYILKPNSFFSSTLSNVVGPLTMYIPYPLQSRSILCTKKTKQQTYKFFKQTQNNSTRQAYHSFLDHLNIVWGIMNICMHYQRASTIFIYLHYNIFFTSFYIIFIKKCLHLRWSGTDSISFIFFNIS